MIFKDMCDAVNGMVYKIHEHPFNQELSRGTLANEKFIFYLTQDALYLADFSRALALTAARLSSHQHAQQYMQFALDAIKAERELHFGYLKGEQEFVSMAEQSPACFMYTNYLLKMVSIASIEEAVASLLPCFWVYREVGRKMMELQKNPHNPYQNWIELYSSELFDRSVASAIHIVNELGHATSDALRKKMIAAFRRSTQLEWMFWDGAYRLEGWQ